MLSVPPLPNCLPRIDGAADQTRAIVSTLIYYDLFSFPPSSTELVRFAHRAGSDGHFQEHDLPAESDWWSSQGGYWFLKGRDHLTASRAQMMQASARKLGKARRWARLLQVVPGVRFIGVTGSLSMESSRSEDDIDFLIITARDRLWLTRALVLGALWAMRVKRADDGRSDHPDQVCANIFLREDDLTIEDHNIFIAHEICQMLPLLGPAGYRSFVKANAWVSDYLPQWYPPAANWQDRRMLRGVRRLGEAVLNGPLLRFLEQELMRRQVARIKDKHARGHNVGVKLSPTQLRFHARDLSHEVVQVFEARWKSIQAGPRSPRVFESSFRDEREGSRV